MKVKEESENVGLKLNTVVLFPYSDQKKKRNMVPFCENVEKQRHSHTLF